MAQDSTTAARIGAWIFNNLSLVSSILRWVKPTLILGDKALVTRFDDVQEVLSRDWVFRVPYAKKMLAVTASNNFFLGMENTPEYTRDVSNMRIAVRRDDIDDRLVPFIEETSHKILSSANGKIDVVQELTRVVPTRLINEYFGIPPWDENEFTDAATYMFQYLFYPDDPEIEKKALQAAARCREHIDNVIRERKGARGLKDDIIERCLGMQDAGVPGMTDLDIRNNLIGLLIGAIPTTSKCAALTLDYLLDHPDLLATAQTSARADDDDVMVKYVLESLRLKPFAAGIQRICAEDYVVARGTLRATKIPKGTGVLAITESAMMDLRRVTKPKEFRLDRPAYIYMHFGFALHTCFGQYINLAQIPRIVKAVLKLEGLRRAPGEAGIMKSVGPFPVNLNLEFNA